MANSVVDTFKLRQVHTPEYLWLLEAFQRFRLETGAGFAFALNEFQALYPSIHVYDELLKATTELLDIMGPVYADRDERTRDDAWRKR